MLKEFAHSAGHAGYDPQRAISNGPRGEHDRLPVRATMAKIIVTGESKEQQVDTSTSTSTIPHLYASKASKQL